MKYIRTKDGRIIDLATWSTIEDFTCVNTETNEIKKDICYERTWFEINGGICEYKSEHISHNTQVLKEADTIEELCDEFVFEDMDGHYLCDFCEQTDIDVGSKFDELKYWFNHSKEQQYKIRNCYGAIWTDKGLIYVAKMNDKGELELL